MKKIISSIIELATNIGTETPAGIEAINIAMELTEKAYGVDWEMYMTQMNKMDDKARMGFIENIAKAYEDADPEKIETVRETVTREFQFYTEWEGVEYQVTIVDGDFVTSDEFVIEHTNGKPIDDELNEILLPIAEAIFSNR